MGNGALRLFICYCWWVVDCAGFLFDCGFGLGMVFGVVRLVGDVGLGWRGLRVGWLLDLLWLFVNFVVGGLLWIVRSSACLGLVRWLLLVDFVTGLLVLLFEVACLGVVLWCCFFVFVVCFAGCYSDGFGVFCLCCCSLLGFLFYCGVSCCVSVLADGGLWLIMLICAFLCVVVGLCFTCCLYGLVWFMVYCLIFFGSCWCLCVMWLFVVCGIWVWDLCCWVCGWCLGFVLVL